MACYQCEFLISFYTKEYTDYLRICTVQEPDTKDGFFIYTEVGNGDHPDCLLFKKKTVKH